MELCVFSDASSWAIGAVAYLRALTDEGEVKVGFVLGKAKLSPRPEPSIPRLGAVRCSAGCRNGWTHSRWARPQAECSEILLWQQSGPRIYLQSVQMLLCLCAQPCSADTSVDFSRPVELCAYGSESSWLATRSVLASQLNDTIWFTGPSFLYQSPQEQTCESFEMVNPDTDTEVRPCVTSFATRAERSLFSERFQCFSTWESLLRAVSFLIHQARSPHVKFHQYIPCMQRMASVQQNNHTWRADSS